MGHDITAYRSDVNAEQLYAEWDLNNHDSGWMERYEEYRARVEVAYNRRSAGNPLNQVLYLALGVMEEAYAGCSGNGAELSISREQLETAQQILDRKRFEGMKRDRNLADHVLEMMQHAGFQVVPQGTPDQDISGEKEFVARCLQYLNETGQDTVQVRFG